MGRDPSVTKRRLRAGGVMAAAVIATLAVAAAVRAHGGDPAAIHACVSDVGATRGEVRITSHPGTPRRFGNPNTECRRGEHALDWSVRGPQGQAGPAGPQGPQGPQGPPGSASSATISRVTFLSKNTAANAKTVTVTCPPGRRAIGGGFEIAGASINAKNVTRSHPVGDPPNAWRVKAFDSVGGTGKWRLRAWAVCTTG